MTMRRCTSTWSATTLFLFPLALLLVSGCGSKRSVTIEPHTEAADGQAAVAKEEKVGGAVYPDDRGGKLLGELLTPPRGAAGDPDKHATAKKLPGIAALERPDLRAPLSLADPGLPSANLTPKTSPIQPHSLPDDPPLTRNPLDGLAVPRREELPAGPTVRIDSPDPDKPMAVPVLAVPVSDRASLDDPTRDYSTGLALAVILPERVEPTPFIKLTLPDPFEHIATVRLRTPPAEDGTPTSPSAKTP